MDRFPIYIIFLVTLFLCSLTSTKAGIIVLNGLTHEDSAQPGESYRGSIKIQNTGKSAKSVRVYQRDYWFSYNGESKHDPAGTLQRSNAEWISYNPGLVTLDSKEVATVDFEVKIPENDTLQGTFWSVIMVEGIVPPDTANNMRGVKINTAVRYAVQIITEIGNSGTSDLRFIGMKQVKQDENYILYVAVENTGERILKPEMNLELFNESGNTAGVIKSDIRKTLPGTSIMLTLVLEDIKPGKYTGVLVADCGEDRLFGTNLSLVIE